MTCPDCGVTKHETWCQVEAECEDVTFHDASDEIDVAFADPETAAKVESVRAEMAQEDRGRPLTAPAGQRCSLCSAGWVKGMERHMQRHAEVAAAALRRVEELHSPVDNGTGPQCQGCATNVTFTPWPCKTIAALRGPR